MTRPLTVTFAGGTQGEWRVERNLTLRGPPLPGVERLAVSEGADGRTPEPCVWSLRGVTSNTRYTEASEAKNLADRQQGLRRPLAICAALIPITKSPAWWALAQDERRAIFEARSHHIAIGMDYLPAIARRLHHSRELGGPFDFLTWFEFAPENAGLFEEMLQRLRASEEWTYVNAESDLRMSFVGR